MDFNAFVIIACILLLAYLIFQEVKRANKHWLWLRLLASCLLVTFLALLAIPIYTVTKFRQTSGVVNVVTVGTSTDSLSKIEGSKYYLDAALDQELKQKAKFIPDLAYYLADHPQVRKVNIYGHGLEENDLKKLSKHEIAFHAPPKPAGIIACNWNDQLQEEEMLKVQGTYNNKSTKPIKLKLDGFGTSLDSVTLPAQSLTPFVLNHQIRHKGKALLQLIGLSGKDTLAKENLAIQATPTVPLKILVLSAFPNFENNFLKKWLYEKRYPVAVRSKISKDKYSFNFLNRPKVTLTNINAALLNKEDVIVMDQDQLETLAINERNAIMQAVNNGLGLILLVDEPSSTSPLVKKLRLIHATPLEKKLDLFVIKARKTLTNLVAEKYLYISNLSNHQILIISKTNGIVAAQELHGLGKIAFTTLSNSYQWVLSGHREDYAQYWSTLISNVARSQQLATHLQASKFPAVKKKLALTINAENTNPPLVARNAVPLVLQQNLIYPNRWMLQTWPTERGWQSVSINQKAFDYFVYGSDDWNALKDVETAELNLKYAEKQRGKSVSKNVTTTPTKHTISKWWFLMGLILVAAFLWWEKKYYA